MGTDFLYYMTPTDGEAKRDTDLPAETGEEDERMVSVKDLTYDELHDPVEKKLFSYDLSEMDWADYLTHFSYVASGISAYREELLASGEISHLLSGENDQSQPDRNNQVTILWKGVSCIYIRDVHARLAQRANRLSARPYGVGVKPVPKPVQHGKWVPDVNVLIIIEQKIGEF